MANVKFEYNGKLSDGRYFDEDSKKKIVVELEDNDLTTSEMLEEFMNFMQAIGYKFELGDRFDVVNDFKFDVKKDDNGNDLNELKIDFSKYDPIVDEGGGVIGVAAKTEVKKVPDAALNAEIERIRSMTMGLSEDGLYTAALNNLTNKGS
jgi:hypothetical protein